MGEGPLLWAGHRVRSCLIGEAPRDGSCCGEVRSGVDHRGPGCGYERGGCDCACDLGPVRDRARRGDWQKHPAWHEILIWQSKPEAAMRPMSTTKTGGRPSVWRNPRGLR